VQTGYGIDISAEDIAETLGFFDDWEERYRYIIDIGKQLPVMPDAERREELLVRGCQSQVWLKAHEREGRLFFEVDSDAHIVRGLIAIVLSAYNGKSPAEILAFDIDAYFERLDLLRHLSPTRGNGLRAMVERIRDVAAAACKASVRP
jgi:cysteine desulfuration protein SufE